MVRLRGGSIPRIYRGWGGGNKGYQLSVVSSDLAKLSVASRDSRLPAFVVRDGVPAFAGMTLLRGKFNDTIFRFTRHLSLVTLPHHASRITIFGGNNLYITGVTSLASIVEVTNPPIITQASGE